MYCQEIKGKGKEGLCGAASRDAPRPKKRRLQI